MNGKNIFLLFLITSIISVQTTSLLGMEHNETAAVDGHGPQIPLDQLERGTLEPLIQIKIWAHAVATLQHDVTVARRSSQPAEEKIRELNTRKDALIEHLNRLQTRYPALFIGCPHILASITRLNTTTRDQMSAEQLGTLLKTLSALQGNFDPLLKDPNISPCLKNTAVVFSMVGGAIITLTGVAYLIVQMIRG